MKDFENFLLQLKGESQRVRSLTQKSPEELGESVLIIKEICKLYNKFECDALAYSFTNADFEIHWIWEYIFIWYNISDEKNYFSITLLRLLISNNKFFFMKENYPILYYYANFFLWSYSNWALRLRNPEGLNAKINILEINYKINEIAMCEGISEDILITLEEMEQADFVSALNSIHNNLDVLDIISDCKNENLSNNVRELISYVRE
jgi:hypothetical protein